MIQRLVSALFICFLASQAWGQATRSNAVEDYVDRSWSITFGGSYSASTLDHKNEVASNPSYASNDRRMKVDDVRLSFSVMKEFLNQNTFSFTGKLFGGLTDSDGKSNDETLGAAEEKVNSIHFGGGVSMNYNMYVYGLKVQPYLGVDLVSEEGDFNMAHTNSENKLNTIHTFDTQWALLSLGVRAFDADVELMSYFQISMPQTLSETVSASVIVNGGNEAVLTSETEITRDPVAFSMGFGYFF